MLQELYQHTFPNGLTLLAEKMQNVRSVSFTFLVPSGAIHDPPEHPGTAAVLVDMMTRGAGNRSSRELSDAMDALGLDHSEGNGLMNQTYSGSLLSRNLPHALELYADVLRRPHLPEEELEAAQSLAIQDIQALEDEPQSKVMVELAKNYYPHPLNRDKRGTIEGVESVTIDLLRKQHQRLYNPKDVILAIAGDIQWDALQGQVEKLFGDWKPQDRPTFRIESSTPKNAHLSKELEQTQIGISFPSVPVTHPEFYNARGMIGVLSLDMSSRLFTNIREKHGLCYSIWASYEAFKDRGTIIGATAGVPKQAQELLDLFLQEFQLLKKGIEEDELDRVKVGLKSSLIMRQESTGARASSIASDWYFLARVRPLEEIQTKINQLTTKSVLGYVNQYLPKDITVVTLGPAPLAINY